MTIEELFVDLVGIGPVFMGPLEDRSSPFSTFVGASVVLVWLNPTKKWRDAALEFAARVMLSASLLLPGIKFASKPEYRMLQLGGLTLAGVVPVLMGVFLGVAVLDRGERWVQYVGPIISN